MVTPYLSRLRPRGDEPGAIRARPRSIFEPAAPTPVDGALATDLPQPSSRPPRASVDVEVTEAYGPQPPRPVSRDPLHHHRRRRDARPRQRRSSRSAPAPPRRPLRVRAAPPRFRGAGRFAAAGVRTAPRRRRAGHAAGAFRAAALHASRAGAPADEPGLGPRTTAIRPRRRRRSAAAAPRAGGDRAPTPRAPTTGAGAADDPRASPAATAPPRGRARARAHPTTMRALRRGRRCARGAASLDRSGAGPAPPPRPAAPEADAWERRAAPTERPENTVTSGGSMCRVPAPAPPPRRPGPPAAAPPPSLNSSCARAPGDARISNHSAIAAMTRP